MPVDAETTAQATPTYLDVVSYRIDSTPPSTEDPDAMGTVSARVLDGSAKEYARPGGNLAENMGAISQADLEAFAATQVGETDEARAVNTVVWLLGRNRENLLSELSATYGTTILNLDPDLI